MTLLGSRIVVAGTHSGVGKTTVATGLMAALSSRGLRVSAAKVGPDFIDPGFHQLATGRPGRNLDPWISGVDSIGPLAARAAADSDLLVIEGVMGLFDGSVDGTPSSTADVAELLDAPIVLVVDGSAMSASVAALVRGFRDHRPSLNLAGVILNRVGSPHHQELLVDALDSVGVATLGCLRRREDLVWRDRHLGLVPVAENRRVAADSVSRLAAVVEKGCDLDKIAAIASSAKPQIHRSVRGAESTLVSDASAAPVRIAVADGPAFTFTYQDNIDALRAAGAEVLPFDPLFDERLPVDIDGLIVGGGFPEVFAERLSANVALRRDVRSRLDAGLVTWVECGGLLWLASSVDAHDMVASIDTVAAMGSRLTLGYREVSVHISNPVAAAGTQLRGHEFHYSSTNPEGDAFTLESRFSTRQEGFASETLLATYLHQHLGDHPEPAQRFVETCRGVG